jgi:predicted RecB family nuclease
MLKEDLAKFGYTLGMKVKKFKNPFPFWLHAKEPNRETWKFFQKNVKRRFSQIWLYTRYESKKLLKSFPVLATC